MHVQEHVRDLNLKAVLKHSFPLSRPQKADHRGHFANRPSPRQNVGPFPTRARRARAIHRQNGRTERKNHAPRPSPQYPGAALVAHDGNKRTKAGPFPPAKRVRRARRARPRRAAAAWREACEAAALRASRGGRRTQRKAPVGSVWRRPCSVRSAGPQAGPAWLTRLAGGPPVGRLGGSLACSTVCSAGRGPCGGFFRGSPSGGLRGCGAGGGRGLS